MGHRLDTRTDAKTCFEYFQMRVYVRTQRHRFEIALGLCPCPLAAPRLHWPVSCVSRYMSVPPVPKLHFQVSALGLLWQCFEGIDGHIFSSQHMVRNMGHQEKCHHFFFTFLYLFFIFRLFKGKKGKKR